MLKKIIKDKLPLTSDFYRIVKSGQQPTFKDYLTFRIGLSTVYWPSHPNCVLANKKNIYIGINSLVARAGNYLQGKAGIFIGNYVQLATNVGILTSNHDLYDQRLSVDAKVVVGSYSWIGMNSVILPGVTLGTRTIVAAGSVVTKSFNEGFCVIGGVPARVIKRLDKSKFTPWRDEYEYYGFIEKEVFEEKYDRIVSILNRELSP